MTPDQLRVHLESLRLGALIHAENDLLRTLEDEATRRPLDAEVRAALLAVSHRDLVLRGVPKTLAGVRRERLVRWDSRSAEFDGVHIQSGTPWRVRVLAPPLVREPNLGRWLIRESRAMARLAGLEPIFEDGWPAVAVPLSGPALCDASEPDGTESAVRMFCMLGGALGDMAMLQAACGLPELGSLDFRLDGDGLKVVCLTPPRQAVDASAIIRALARLLSRWWGRDEGAGLELLAGFEAFPPASVDEARQAWGQEAAKALAGEWHRLRKHRKRVSRDTRASRTLAAIRRMDAAVPPPVGRGAVGVDLEGRVTVVEGRPDGSLWWGPAAAMEQVAGDQLQARLGRRLLRARAAAPGNPRLDADVGGEAGYADEACRWLDLALQLRTLRMLLETRVGDAQG